MADPVADFLNQQFGPDSKATGLLPTRSEAPIGVSGLGDTFRRGVRSGVSSMSADVDYFQALASTLAGADDLAADNIAQARYNEERAADRMKGLESFEEFVDTPTVEGFFTQVASGVGQLVPSAISTVAGAGVGSVAALAGRGVLSVSGKLAAKKVVRESLDKVARGVAKPDDREIAQTAWELYRKGAGKAAQSGALAGAGGSEYVPLAGSNLSESLESGRELDPLEAIRAGLVAVPQAAIGVGGEVALLKLIGDKANKISTGNSSVMGRLGKDIAEGFFRGGVTESATEVAQEGISVLNRSQMDENFTAQDAQMRLGQAAFAAFFGGAAAGSAGAGLGGAAREIMDSPDRIGGVIDEAREWLDQGREQQVNEQTALEQVGEVVDGEFVGGATGAQYSNPEPQADIKAQLVSMLDPQSSKSAVWVEGAEPAMGVSATGKINANLEINGQRVAGAFIPGRGTIISPYADVVDEVIKGGASDTVLSQALGYGSTKPASGADRVVQVKDAKGRVISEEAANDESLPAAIAAAEGIMNRDKGDSFQIIDMADALRERNQRLDDEQGPIVRNLDLPDEVIEAFQGEDLSDPSFNIDELDAYQADNFKARTPNENGEFPVFKSTQRLRSRYDELFGDTDWASDFYGGMSDSAIGKAIDLAEAGVEVEIISPSQQTAGTKAAQEGMYTVNALNFEGEVFKTRVMRDGEQVIKRVLLPQFLRNEVTQASQQPKGNRNATVVRPADKSGKRAETKVSLVSLINAGRRIDQVRNPEGMQTTGTALLAIVGDLIANGYEIKLGTTKAAPNLTDDSALGRADLPAEMQSIRDEDSQSGATTTNSNSERTLLDAFMRAASDPSESNIAALGGFAQVTAGKVNGETFTISDLLKQATPESAGFDAQERETRNAAFPAPLGGKRANSLIIDYPDTRAEYPESGVVAVNNQNTRVKAQSVPKQDPETTKALNAVLQTNAYEYGDPEAGLLATMGEQEQNLRIERLVKQTRLEDGNRSPGQPTRETITDAGAGQDGFENVEGDGDRFGGETQSFNRTGSPLIDDVAAPNHRYSTYRRENKAPKVNAPLTGKGSERGTPDLVLNILNTVMSKLGMKRPTDLILASHLAGLPREQMLERLNLQIADPVVAKRILDEFINLMQSETGLGRMVGFADANFILVNDTRTANDLETALVAAHELGHAFFREEVSGLSKKPVFKKLMAAFEAAKENPETKAAYSGPLGFEEWYADQVGAWAFGEYRNSKATNLVDSYFKRLVAKLREMWKAVRTSLQRRMGTVDVTFESYMQDVVRSNANNNRASEQTASRQATSAGGINTEVQVRNLNDMVEENVLQSETLANQIRNIINGLRENPAMNPIRKFLYTADSYLRSVAGKDVADMFYRLAQEEGSGGDVGMLKRRDRALRKLRRKFTQQVGPLDDPNIQAAVNEAASDTPTADLTGRSLLVRQFLRDVYSEYVLPAQRRYPPNSPLRVDFAEDYFPIVHNLLAVSENSDAYLDLLTEYNPEVDPRILKAAVTKMISYQNAVNNQDLTTPSLDPAAGVGESRVLTANIPPQVLQERGFLVDPSDAIMMYLGSLTKRVEWNRATRDAKGADVLGPLLSELDDKKKKEALDVIDAYLGYGNQSMNPHWRKVQSYVAAAQYTLILPLAVIGSLPELAGPIINSKDFSAFEYAFRTMKESLSKREARELAEDIGVVSNDMLTNGYITAAEQEHLDPAARKWTDAFFRITMLDQYTNFTRTWATGMGVQFLIRHAENRTGNPNSARYLKDLGVSAADVRTWMGDRDLTTASGARVSAALYKFVESSILRPNAAERPVWASDPRFLLIWQLKSYFYAFHKVITGGVLNELEARNQGVGSSEQKIKNGVGLLALAAAASLPLAMMGMELREYAKDAAAETLTLGFNDKNFFRTDNMSWGDYISTAIEKTGVYGPVGLLMMAQQSSKWGQGGVATLLGPTAETLELTMQDGFEVIPDRLIPIYSYLY